MHQTTASNASCIVFALKNIFLSPNSSSDRNGRNYALNHILVKSTSNKFYCFKYFLPSYLVALLIVCLNWYSFAKSQGRPTNHGPLIGLHGDDQFLTLPRAKPLPPFSFHRQTMTQTQNLNTDLQRPRSKEIFSTPSQSTLERRVNPVSLRRSIRACIEIARRPQHLPKNTIIVYCA